MFEQFTREARQVVNSAVEEAERRGDPVLGTEHLLLGLASSYAAFGAIFLEDFGISLESLRSGLMDRDAAALASIGIDIDLDSVDATKEPHGLRKHRPFTKGAKAALVQALREALNLGHRHIGAEHILLALTDGDPEDDAIKLLLSHDVDPVAMRGAVLEMLRASA